MEGEFEFSKRLESYLVSEEGFREMGGGLRELSTKDGVLLDVASKLIDSKCVVLLVGSTTNMIMWPPTDTDGVGGCFAIAHALLQLGIKVYILTDTVNDGQIQPALEKSDAFRYNNRKLSDMLIYEVFNERTAWTEEEDIKLKNIFDEADHIINVGRPGPAKDGEYYNFEGRVMTHYQPFFENLFKFASESRSKIVTTTCIGELGNELGMGELSSLVSRVVQKGAQIGCVVKCDQVIVSTFVNLGAYGLVAILAALALARNPHLFFDDLFPSYTEQANILKCLVQEASRCGVTGTRDEIIDKFPAAKVGEMMDYIRADAREFCAQKNDKNNNINDNNIINNNINNNNINNDTQTTLLQGS